MKIIPRRFRQIVPQLFVVSVCIAVLFSPQLSASQSPAIASQCVDIVFPAPHPDQAPSSADVRPDTLLVRLTPASSQLLNDVVQAHQFKGNPAVDPGLQAILQRNGVKTLERSFPQALRQKARMDRIGSSSPESLTAEDQRLQIRLHRAPTGAKVPDLSCVFRLALSLPPGRTLDQAAAELQSHPSVVYAQPDHLITITATPDDSLYSHQWGLHNTGQTYSSSGAYNPPPGTPDADIDAPEAWDVTTGNTGVIIAVVDTGVDYNHRDLNDKMWTNSVEQGGSTGVDDDNNGFVDDIYGYDFTQANQVRDSNPMDDHGHGTHIAGIIAAETNNSQDVAGVCWLGSIMAVRALTSDGTGYSSDGADAMIYAANEGADIISVSWGYGSTLYDDYLSDAVDYAVSLGCVILASAGNDNLDVVAWPAVLPKVISVSASNSLDAKAPFSNYLCWLDLAAPGVDIMSLRASGTSRGTIYDGYNTVLSGTSMSCPYAAGVAGLILARNPSFTYEQVRSVLKMTSDPVSTTEYIGQGRINAGAAVGITSTPPIAELNIPILEFATERKAGKIPISGTASGGNFEHYEISWATGVAPVTWTTVHTSTTPITNGVLMAEFDTEPGWDGLISVRLSVFDTMGRRIDTARLMNLQNFKTISPLNLTLVKPGPNIPIYASINAPPTNMVVEIGYGFNPSSWTTDGITVQNGTNDLWAYWTTEPDEEGFANIRFTFDTASATREQFIEMIYLQPRLKPGFPVHIPRTADSVGHENLQDIIVSDMDGDGDAELVTVKSAPNEVPAATLMTYNHLGQLLWEQPGLLGFAPYYDVPNIGDLDNDGDQEIVFFTGWDWDGYSMYVYDHDGTLATGSWPARPKYASFERGLIDINNDDSLEILVNSGGGPDVAGLGHCDTVQVYNPTGTQIKILYFPTEGWDYDPEPFLTYGQFDEDPELEIVTPWGANEVAVHNLDGSFVSGWPAFTSTDVIKIMGLTAGDVDGDGNDDVFITTWGGPGQPKSGVWLFDSQGQVWPGWPVLNGDMSGGGDIRPAAMADFDGDSDLEMTFCSGRDLFVYHHTGVLATGWPQRVGDYAFLYRMPTVGDVDGDEQPDIVVTGGGFQPVVVQIGEYDSAGGIYAFRFDGSRIDLNNLPNSETLFLPLPQHISWFRSPATLADIDNDGMLDLVTSNISGQSFGYLSRYTTMPHDILYAFDMGTPYKPHTMHWPLPQANAAHENRYIAPPELVLGAKLWTMYE